MNKLKAKPFYLNSQVRTQINTYNSIEVLDALNEKLGYQDKEGEDHRIWLTTFLTKYLSTCSILNLNKIYNLLSEEAQKYITFYQKDKRKAFIHILTDNRSSELKKYLVYLYIRDIFS